MRSEVPYITTAQVQSAKGEKWSDGAVGWHGEHVGALIEAKALVAHTASKVCKDIRDKVAPDLAAMLGIDREATLSRRPGTYEDPEWSIRRTQLQRLYALQFVLVHGVEARSCRELLSDALGQGVTRVVTPYVAQQPTGSLRSSAHMWTSRCSRRRRAKAQAQDCSLRGLFRCRGLSSGTIDNNAQSRRWGLPSLRRGATGDLGQRVDESGSVQASLRS